MTIEPSLLVSVFGKSSAGETPEQRASTSKQLFVRSQHQLSLYHESATGRVINANEALRLFGWEVLKELADHSATPILKYDKEPYQSISAQLDRLGLTFIDVAPKFGWTKDDISRFQNKQQVPFRSLEKMAQGIDLNEEELGVVADAGADKQLSVRLKKFKSDDPKRFTVNAVLALTEAAWVTRKQFELAELLGEEPRETTSELGFSPSDDYGNKLSPDYKKGYELARQTRKFLGLKPDDPISSLKELIEVKLAIPVVQLELGQEFAGATIATGGDRGIVINLNGDNSNPLVRRMTMAHELGHLLWDPDQRLDKLRVDRYDELQTNVQLGKPLDHVERRANAFAVELLAPGDAIVSAFTTQGGGTTGLTHVIEKFGVSRTATMHHLENASHNNISTVEGGLGDLSIDVWEANELLALPLFRPQDVPVSRRGRFAYFIYKAHANKLISDDTAASLFRCKFAELPLALKTARELVG